MNTTRVCRYCRRSSRNVRLRRIADYGGKQYYECADEDACENYLGIQPTAYLPPPVDQLMRIIGAPELPGFWEAR